METDSTTNAIINTAKTSNNSMNQNENEHLCIPERLLPLFNAKMSERETLAKWIDEFLPRPEPPRFFRPLCSRLARQNEILREQEKRYTENANKEMEEVRKRLNMSIRQIREEQKTQLKEKRIEQKQKRLFFDFDL
jgi:exonuclease VII large subunit